MNIQETARYYKETCLQKQFEKRLQAKVDRDDLALWSKGFNSAVEIVDEDIKKENREKHEQDEQDEKNHQQFLTRTMEADFGCK